MTLNPERRRAIVKANAVALRKLKAAHRDEWLELLAAERAARDLPDAAPTRSLVAACGTPSGYKRHRRDSEPVCAACRTAWNADMKQRRQSQADSPMPAATGNGQNYKAARRAVIEAGRRLRDLHFDEYTELRQVQLDLFGVALLPSRWTMQ